MGVGWESNSLYRELYDKSVATPNSVPALWTVTPVDVGVDRVPITLYFPQQRSDILLALYIRPRDEPTQIPTPPTALLLMLGLVLIKWHPSPKPRRNM
jgi:hypothetical protein